MDSGLWRRGAAVVLSFLAIWLGIRYLLPILLPFGLGLAFALMAEPGVRFLEKRLRFPRALACAVAVSGGFVMIFALVWILGAVVYRELTVLAEGLPVFFEGISETVSNLRHWSMGLVRRAPEGLQGSLRQWITNLFAGGNVLLEQAATGIVGILAGVMGGIPGGALLAGTAVISSFMISAQLPALKKKLRKIFQRQWLQKWMRTAVQMKHTAQGWLKAQLKLSTVTYVIAVCGFLILRVGHPLFWGLITALVDAVPLLGTGVVLIPWSLWSFLQGNGVRAVGLLGVYVTAMVTRSALEPRLVGSQLGMNPLMTLLTLYAGYQLWGVGGMILAPILMVTARQLMTMKE